MPSGLAAGAGFSGFAEGFGNTFAQIFAQKRLQKTHQENELHQFLLKSAMKGDIPFDNPEVSKAAKSLFGKHSDAVLTVGQAVLEHHLSTKNAFAQDLEDSGGDVDAAVKTALAKGHQVPEIATSMLTQYGMRPKIAAAETEATRAGRVKTTEETTAARENVEEPYRQQREGRAETRATNRETRAEARRKADAAEKRQQKVADDAAKEEAKLGAADEKLLPKNITDRFEAVDERGTPQPMATVGDFKAARAKKWIREKGGFLQSIGLKPPGGRLAPAAPSGAHPLDTLYNSLPK
jgi:hypothetical protein